MKKITVILVFLVFLSCQAQNDSIQKERYDVINALYKNHNPKHERSKLSKNFFQFRGLSALISNPKLIDNLLGHCADYQKKEVYSFADIFKQKELDEIRFQINWFSAYRYIDELLINDNILIVDDLSNTHTAITLPLIVNDKAIVYRTNKDNEDTLLVLIKKNGEWEIRCRKNIYLRFDD